MKTTTAAAIAALFLSLPAAVGAADSPVETALAPLAFLAGHCWVTQVGEGGTDTHCYEWMHGGRQLRDRHVVRGKDPDYFGETIYAYNGERERVEYRYWNSLGGVSDGRVAVAADGALEFLDDRYVGADGAVYLFASEMRQPADGKYRFVSRVKDGEAWKEMPAREFTRQ
jgi:hypothetical protein